MYSAYTAVVGGGGVWEEVLDDGEDLLKAKMLRLRILLRVCLVLLLLMLLFLKLLFL